MLFVIVIVIVAVVVAVTVVVVAVVVVILVVAVTVVVVAVVVVVVVVAVVVVVVAASTNFDVDDSDLMTDELKKNTNINKIAAWHQNDNKTLFFISLEKPLHRKKDFNRWSKNFFQEGSFCIFQSFFRCLGIKTIFVVACFSFLEEVIIG